MHTPLSNAVSTTTIAIGALTTATIAVYYTWRSSSSASKGCRSLNELPGPKPKPLIGNARDFPTKARYQVFSKYREQY
ncbi:hypothetical protein FRC16_007603, partial [Serendipita sp. 398]